MIGAGDMTFSAHNVQFPNGESTIPDMDWFIGDHPWLKSTQRLLRALYPDNQGKRIVDRGCLEGGYTLELARMGFDALGIEVRQSNIDNCLEIKDAFKLPNLDFAKDDVWNLDKYGQFDVAFCCGLLYHLDRPREFINKMAQHAKVVVINTHFATDKPSTVFSLSELTTNEDLPGRWYGEHETIDLDELEQLKWTSWENNRSFWLTRPGIFQALHDAGFDIVFEQVDQLAGFHGQSLLENMTSGYYATQDRGTFVGIKQP
jgi:SAM-dependent methyltransferase